ncbi:MAG TPA: hypothetical protein DDZ84_01695 [Firmicutes bacterium]|nr:hypothetical protein [Bacillota bacterium]
MDSGTSLRIADYLQEVIPAASLAAQPEMMRAYDGRVLWVDLTTERTWAESVRADWKDGFIGGRGIAARYLWDLVPPGTDPLGADNVIMFSAGAVSGTSVPSSGRTTVTCLSPATGLYLKTSAGGSFAPAMRYAGYDHIVVKGTAERPVWIHIADQDVSIRDASELWGLGVRDTSRAIKRILRDDDAETASIGPAGENMVNFASVMCSVYNAAGRGGAGAVMGSKKLKTIAIQGSGGIEVAVPDEFYRRATALREAIRNDEGAQGISMYGTAVSVEAINEMGSFPTRNFQRGQVDDAYPLSGQALVERGFLRHRPACFACPIACHRFSRTEFGPFKSYSAGPEYETFSSLGAGCGVTDTAQVMKANEACNDYGMDTISSGVVVQWLFECAQRGLSLPESIRDLDLTWGNIHTLLELLRRIACREGAGDILARGVRGASEEIGQGSDAWAMQDRGLEQSSVDTRLCNAYALAFAVNPRGPDHLFAQPLAEFGGSDKARQVIERITGDSDLADPRRQEKRAEIVRWHEDVYAATEALGMCIFLSTGACWEASPEAMAGLISAAFGEDVSAERLMLVGRRTITLERCFNVRLGAGRHTDRAPKRMMNEPSVGKDGKARVISRELLDRMLDDYYALHQWDSETGWPTVQTLRMLQLDDVATDMLERGIPLRQAVLNGGEEI